MPSWVSQTLTHPEFHHSLTDKGSARKTSTTSKGHIFTPLKCGFCLFGLQLYHLTSEHMEIRAEEKFLKRFTPFTPDLLGIQEVTTCLCPGLSWTIFPWVFFPSRRGNPGSVTLSPSVRVGKGCRKWPGPLSRTAETLSTWLVVDPTWAFLTAPTIHIHEAINGINHLDPFWYCQKSLQHPHNNHNHTSRCLGNQSFSAGRCRHFRGCKALAKASQGMGCSSSPWADSHPHFKVIDQAEYKNLTGFACVCFVLVFFWRGRRQL